MSFLFFVIEKDHLGDWSPEKDCCWRLMFRQPVRRPSSESSDQFSQLKKPLMRLAVKTCAPLGYVNEGVVR